jgi:hypothetical protein
MYCTLIALYDCVSKPLSSFILAPHNPRSLSIVHNACNDVSIVYTPGIGIIALRQSTAPFIPETEPSAVRSSASSANMLCKVCVGMLRGGRGELWAGTHDLTFEHHKTTTSLRRSREADCSICIALANVLRSDMDLLEDRPISIKASLKRLAEDGSKEIKYCLDFDLERTHNRIYLLKETGMSWRICS